MTLIQNGFYSIFIELFKIVSTLHLKHSSLWLMLKAMKNYIVHVMSWQCMFALSICLLQSLGLSTLPHPRYTIYNVCREIG